MEVPLLVPVLVPLELSVAVLLPEKKTKFHRIVDVIMSIYLKNLEPGLLEEALLVSSPLDDVAFDASLVASRIKLKVYFKSH